MKSGITKNLGIRNIPFGIEILLNLSRIYLGTQCLKMKWFMLQRSIQTPKGYVYIQKCTDLIGGGTLRYIIYIPFNTWCILLYPCMKLINLIFRENFQMVEPSFQFSLVSMKHISTFLVMQQHIPCIWPLATCLKEFAVHIPAMPMSSLHTS